VGYELTNERGTVVAEAELAWVSLKTALVLNESALNAFTSLNWKVATIAQVQGNPEAFRQTHQL